MTVTIGVQSLTATVQSGGAWSVTATALSDGTRTVTAVVADTVGNEGSATQQLTIDTVAPSLAINGGATRVDQRSNPHDHRHHRPAVGTTVTVTVAGQTLTARCRAGHLDGDRDDADRRQPTLVRPRSQMPAATPRRRSQSLTVDTVAPVVTITGGAAVLTNDATPTISGSATRCGGGVHGHGDGGRADVDGDGAVGLVLDGDGDDDR